MDVTPTKPYCVACLSTNRKLGPIIDVAFFTSLTLLQLPDASKTGLCWECNAVVMRARLFRQRVFNAQQILNGSVTHINVPLSTMCRKALVSIHIEPLNSIEPEEVKVEMLLKTEITENDPKEEDPIRTDHCEMDQDLKEVKQEESDSDDEPLDQIKREKMSSKNETIGNINPNLTQEKPILIPLNSNLSIEDPLTLNPAKQAKTTVKTIKLLESQDDTEKNKSYTIKILTEEELIESRKKTLKEIRDKGRKFVCEMCVESFKQDVLLASHMKVHDVSTGAFACRICEVRFQGERIMKAHTESHFRMYACSKCKKVFPTLHKYNKHYDIHHDPNLTKCNQCDAKFRMKRHLVIHKRVHSERIECPVCKKMVKSYILNNHLLIHKRHPTVECDICHKEYNGKHRLEAHKRNIHKQKDDRAFCVECGISFKSVAIYKMHLERNAKHVNKQQQCPHCERKFSCTNYLNGHIQRAHIDTSGFTCEQCKELFVSKVSLRRHVRKVHEKRIAPKDKICNICGKGFQLSIVLRQHINGHMNIRPFKCEHCGDSFTNKGARYNHIKLKHKKNETKSKTATES